MLQLFSDYTAFVASWVVSIIVIEFYFIYFSYV